VCQLLTNGKVWFMAYKHKAKKLVLIIRLAYSLRRLWSMSTLVSVSCTNEFSRRQKVSHLLSLVSIASLLSRLKQLSRNLELILWSNTCNRNLWLMNKYLLLRSFLELLRCLCKRWVYTISVKNCLSKFEMNLWIISNFWSWLWESKSCLVLDLFSWLLCGKLSTLNRK